jgi:PIN domain nuclease of toxin-antitoxin system
MESPEVILLDTCALLWVVNGDPISSDVLKALKKGRDTGAIFLSPVSAWEIGILAQRGKVELGLPAENYISRAFTQPGIQIAALTPEIAVRASYLPGQFHSDPADRLLLSTAILMGLTLVTRDREILRYAGRGHVSALRC